MKPAGQKIMLGCGVVLALLLFTSESEGRRSAALLRSGRQDREQPLVEALSNVSRQTGERIVVELPERPATVTLQGASARNALRDITEQMGMLKSDLAGITVLRPKSYAAANPAEFVYRESTRNLISFLKELSPTQKKALAAGNWLDAAQLKPEDQEHVRLALYEDGPTAGDWESYKMQGKIAVTFLFDPYIEPLAEGESFGPQNFFHVSQTFPDFTALHPGNVPGILVSTPLLEDR